MSSEHRPLEPLPGEPQRFSVSLVWSPAARQTTHLELHLALPCTAAQAVRLSGLMNGLTDPELDALTLAVWGRKVAPDQPLHDGDRLEILRPLKVDPKVARRERFSQQGAKSAGLFAQRRAGSKAGY